MAELKWLEGYSGQKTEELIALEGEYRTDSLILAFEQALDQKAGRLGKAKLTAEERVVLAIEALEREVMSGGYAQFFSNTTKEFAPIVVDALNRIGCSETAELTQQAIDCLGIDGTADVEAFRQAIEQEDEERDERLDECDEHYARIAGDLSGPLFKFIKRNRKKIRLKGA